MQQQKAPISPKRIYHVVNPLLWNNTDSPPMQNNKSVYSIIDNVVY